MLKFFWGNGQAFISKKEKDLAVKIIPFVLKSYGKVSLLDNLESQRNIHNHPLTYFQRFYCF